MVPAINRVEKTWPFKTETAHKKYRVFPNRFSAYILQEKDKKPLKRKEWRIVNAFRDERQAFKFLESTQLNQLKTEYVQVVAK